MLGTAALFVKLDSAKNLPVTNPARGTVSAYCKLTLGNETYTSQVGSLSMFILSRVSMVSFITATYLPNWNHLPFLFMIAKIKRKII